MSDVIKEMKEKDPNTAITLTLLYELIRSESITAMKYGNAWLINIDELYAFLKGVKL